MVAVEALDYLILIGPIAALPALALAARADSRAFRRRAITLAVLSGAIAVVTFLFGGLAFAPAALLLLAAGVAPNEHGRRGVGYAVGVALVAALLMIAALFVAAGVGWAR
jgi:hypothetical protein